jgi:hypothetical protein
MADENDNSTSPWQFQKGNPGRPRGAVNKTRVMAVNAIRYDGRNPAEELHKIGFDEQVELSERTRALTAAAPYYVPKVPQYLRNPIDIPKITIVGEALAQISRLITLAGEKVLGLDEAQMLIRGIDSWVKTHHTSNLEMLVSRVRAELRGLSGILCAGPV